MNVIIIAAVAVVIIAVSLMMNISKPKRGISGRGKCKMHGCKCYLFTLKIYGF